MMLRLFKKETRRHFTYFVRFLLVYLETKLLKVAHFVYIVFK